MTNYDLTLLSPFEFEGLVRDLLQAKWNIHIESFTSGADSGIDLRFARGQDDAVVVQCKAYGQYADLSKSLRKEAEKVRKLGCGRYIVATTVALTPKRKDTILSIFEDVPLTAEDILGKDDLNNLISQFAAVEQKYYKLWIGGTAVLDRIIHRKLVNTAAFERSAIDECVRTFVQNSSFDEALGILREHHFAIISGIPGIGKSTLARMLAFFYVSQGFGNIVSLDDSIAGALEVYEEKVPQIFLYDDFLGSNFLELPLSKNEDALLLTFMKRVSESKNKLLVMTTREYILQQALQRYEKLSGGQLELGKYILDLSSYTRRIRAQILYNHVYFSSVESKHVANLLRNRHYLKIIDHQNYNPRVLESILSSGRLRNIESSEFSATIIDALDNPQSVWAHAFENQISAESRLFLLVLLSIGAPVLEEDFRSACASFSKAHSTKYGIHGNQQTVRKVLKEIDGSFVMTDRDDNGTIAVRFKDPSVPDFLFHQLRDSPDIAADIVSSSCFWNQFFGVFTFTNRGSVENGQKKIQLSSPVATLAFERMNRMMDSLDITTLESFGLNGPWKLFRHRDSNELSKLAYVSRQIEGESIHSKKLISSIADRFESLIGEELSGSDIAHAIEIHSVVHSKLGLSAESVIRKFAESVESTDEILELSVLAENFPEEVARVFSNETTVSMIQTVVRDERWNASDDELETLVEQLELIMESLPVDLSDDRDAILQKIDDIRSEVEDAHRTVAQARKEPAAQSPGASDGEIEEMFASLRRR